MASRHIHQIQIKVFPRKVTELGYTANTINCLVRNKQAPLHLSNNKTIKYNVHKESYLRNRYSD